MHGIDKGECGVLFTNDLSSCGGPSSCWDNPPPDFGMRSHDMLLCQFLHRRADRHPPPLRFVEGGFNVAIHVRAGDRGVRAGDRPFWENLWRTVILLTRSFPRVGVYVFTEGKRGRLPKGFRFLDEVFRGEEDGRVSTTFVLDMEEGETMQHFAASDLLVCTGSGFCDLGWHISLRPVLLGVWGSGSERSIGLDESGNLKQPITVEEAEQRILVHQYSLSGCER
jgi:hypothetical protein